MLSGVYSGVIFWHPALHLVRKPVDTKALYPCSSYIMCGELGINFLRQSSPFGFALSLSQSAAYLHILQTVWLDQSKNE